MGWCGLGWWGYGGSGRVVRLGVRVGCEGGVVRAGVVRAGW